MRDDDSSSASNDGNASTHFGMTEDVSNNYSLRGAADASNAKQADGIWDRGPSWLRWPALGIAVLVGLLTICALVYAVLVIFNIPLPGFMDHVGAVDKSGTGEIGDTFGGLLAPILTAGALVATVLFAIQQGDQAKESTKEQIEASERSTTEQIANSKELFQTELRIAEAERERHRAEQVYAWIAETVEEDSSYWRGILVINDSRVPAQKVDFKVSVESGSKPVESTFQSYLPSGEGAGGSRDYFDREAIIPPGKWFIPFQTGTHGDPTSDSAFQWRTLMPVDSSSGLFVRIDSPAEDAGDVNPEKPEGGYRSELTVHSRTKGVYNEQEILLPYYTVRSMRYHLDGAQWLRVSSHGVFRIDDDVRNGDDNVRRDAETAALAESWPPESVMDELEVTPRAYAGRKKLPLSDLTRPVAGFLEFVLRKVAVPSSADVLHDAYTKGLLPQAEVLSGVRAVELYGKKKEAGRNLIHSQTIGFDLTDGGKLLIPVARLEGGTVFKFPGDQMSVQRVANEEIKLEGYGNGVPTRLKRVAKRVIDGIGSPASDKYSENFWLSNEGVLVVILQALVDEAAAIVRDAKSNRFGEVSND